MDASLLRDKRVRALGKPQGHPFPISLLILISYFFTTRLTVELDFCKVGDPNARWKMQAWTCLVHFDYSYSACLII